MRRKIRQDERQDQGLRGARACGLDRAHRRRVEASQAGGFKEISTAVAEFDKGWIQLRDKLCPVFDKIEPGFLPADGTYCRMQVTAHRALLLRRLGDAVNEH